MASFAELDENNVVIRVLKVPDEQEHRGAEYLSEDLELGGRWLQCSFSEAIRGCFPAPGAVYDPEQDIFYFDDEDVPTEELPSSWVAMPPELWEEIRGSVST